jgi:hypothetical protein
MPASDDKIFYEMLDSIAETTDQENAVQQNKRMKEEQFAADSAEPNDEETEAIRQDVVASKCRAQDAVRRASSKA